MNDVNTKLDSNSRRGVILFTFIKSRTHLRMQSDALNVQSCLRAKCSCVKCGGNRMSFPNTKQTDFNKLIKKPNQ